MIPNRRSFLCGSAATLAAASTSSIASLAADGKQSNSAIDAHVHVWSPDTAKYPLSPRFKQSAMKPPSFTAEDLFAHSKPAGVDRIVLIQMSFYEYDHTYMTEVMNAHPGVFSGVALIDHHSPQLVAKMKGLADSGMRGFRLHSRGDAKSWPNDSGMQTLWKTAAEHDLAVCPLINPSDIGIVHQLCKSFPETKVVIDHFARVGISGTIVSEELDRLCELAKFPNTHVKTSAFYALGKKTPPYNDLLPMIRRVYESFGPNRLMWASDCPFQVQGIHDYESSISLIRDRADFLSESDKRAILHDTAARVYFS